DTKLRGPWAERRFRSANLALTSGRELTSAVDWSTYTALAAPPQRLRTLGCLGALVISVECGEHARIGRFHRGRIETQPQNFRHLRRSFAARTSERHRHRGADRVGREDDVAFAAGELRKQLLTRGVVGLHQGLRPGILCDGGLRLPKRNRGK